MELTDDQFYALALYIGFPTVHPPDEDGITDLCVSLLMIALRETGGTLNASLLNDNPKTGDYSLGVLQINLSDKDVVLGLAERYPEALIARALYDPKVNLKAYYKLYAGSRHNMDILSYIDRPGEARDRYLANRARAEAAAQRWKERQS